MKQYLTSSPVSKAIYSTVTSKGQITIPSAIRKHLGIDTSDTIAFIIRPTGIVEVKSPKYPTLALLRGAAGTLKKPLSWQEIEAIAQDDKAAAYRNKSA